MLTVIDPFKFTSSAGILQAPVYMVEYSAMPSKLSLRGITLSAFARITTSGEDAHCVKIHADQIGAPASMLTEVISTALSPDSSTWGAELKRCMLPQR